MNAHMSYLRGAESRSQEPITFTGVRTVTPLPPARFYQRGIFCLPGTSHKDG
jgi:hypothetical protein